MIHCTVFYIGTLRHQSRYVVEIFPKKSESYHSKIVSSETDDHLPSAEHSESTVKNYPIKFQTHGFPSKASITMVNFDH